MPDLRTEIHYSKIQLFILIALRIVVGYHFLYEGLEKLFNPNWTSAGYLLGANWILIDFFNYLATSSLLSLVDFINIWGQIIIGITLLIGLFSKYTAWAGALLLMFYYIVNPPFITGQLFVNIILLELMAIIIIAVFPTSNIYGIDRFLTKVGKDSNG